MVRHHHEIQRSRKFSALSAGSDNFLALGKAVRILGTEPCTERTCIHRVRGVRVRVAEIRPGREVAPRIRRIGRLGGKRLVGRLLVQRTDVGGQILGRNLGGKCPGHTKGGKRGYGNVGQTDHDQAPFKSRQWLPLVVPMADSLEKQTLCKKRLEAYDVAWPPDADRLCGVSASADSIDWAATVHGPAGGDRTRNRPSHQPDAGSHDAAGGIANVLAVNHGTGGLTAGNNDSGDEQRGQRSR